MSYEETLRAIIKKNGGFITRKQSVAAGISSQYLSHFSRKNGMEKVAPGFFVLTSFDLDTYFLFQKRYPKFIFSGYSALFLNNLTELSYAEMEVTGPRGYHPYRKLEGDLTVHHSSNAQQYESEIVEVKTIFGNKVRCYSPERAIADAIVNRNKLDPEIYFKALMFFKEKHKRVPESLKNYAKIIGKEREILDILEPLFYVD